MKQQVKIGVVCIARNTFDAKAAKSIYETIQEDLKQIEAVKWKFIPNLVIEIRDAQDAAHQLNTAELDAYICISGTFALGHLILELNKIMQKPILLWGLKELPYDGGKIRLNSVCGVNLNASNLYKAGVRNFHIIFGDNYQKLNHWIDAIRIKSAFHQAHIGIIGYRAKGFFNLDVDELDLYNQTGILIDHFELNEVFQTEIDEKDQSTRKLQIKKLFNTSGVSEEQIDKVASLTVKFNQFIENNQITALAIRCWPEFASQFGISPCAAMSILQAEGKILTCEGDILGSLSQLAHKAIGGTSPFLADFSQVDFEDDFALLWHCGVAACNLWDGKSVRSLDSYFAGGKGVTADFVMKSGDISLARIDYAPGEYRILVQRGIGQPMEKGLKGTYLKATFEEGVQSVLNKIIYNGIAHHISVVYGNFIQPFKIFAKLMNWEIIE